MADPECGRTTTGYTSSNITSTTSSYEGSCTVTSTRSTYQTAGYYVDSIRQISQILIKKLEKIKAFNELRSSWIPKKPKLIPSAVRPDIQLRGVCFGGRGWA